MTNMQDHYPTDVATAPGTEFEKYGQHLHNRDGSIWEAWPHNLKLVGAHNPKHEMTRHDLRFLSGHRVDYIWVPGHVREQGYETIVHASLRVSFSTRMGRGSETHPAGVRGLQAEEMGPASGVRRGKG